VLALLVVAVALGLSNLAAAIGIGLTGVRGGQRALMAVVFGVFEAGMPLLGLLLGRGMASGLGHAARWLGGGLLILVGCYGLVQAYRNGRARSADVDGPPLDAPVQDWRIGRVAASGLALSVDNLVAGFALGAYHVAIGLAAAVIGVVSTGMSLLGFELGARLGSAFGARSDLVASVVLVAVGTTIAAGVL
jgi:putative Mn2+ efflux pump MntP